MELKQELARSDRIEQQIINQLPAMIENGILDTETAG
jgi:hypothetical protein